MPHAIAIRNTSSVRLFGLPLYDIALGRDPETGRAGHAVGILAIGQLASGIVAIGAVAQGVLAIGAVTIAFVPVGAVAVGALSFGAVSIGVDYRNARLPRARHRRGGRQDLGPGANKIARDLGNR